MVRAGRLSGMQEKVWAGVLPQGQPGGKPLEKSGEIYYDGSNIWKLDNKEESSWKSMDIHACCA